MAYQRTDHPLIELQSRRETVRVPVFRSVPVKKSNSVRHDWKRTLFAQCEVRDYCGESGRCAEGACERAGGKLVGPSGNLLK
jgi:hypothetical protein